MKAAVLACVAVPATAGLCASTALSTPLEIELSGIEGIDFEGFAPSVTYHKTSGVPKMVVKGHSGTMATSTVSGRVKVSNLACDETEAPTSAPASISDASGRASSNWVKAGTSLAASCLAGPRTGALFASLSLAAQAAAADDNHCEDVVTVEIHSEEDTVMDQLKWQSTAPVGALGKNYPIHAVGEVDQFIAEASDCSQTPGCVIEDGKSGDVAFPFVDMKILATVGEFNFNTGHMLVGVPDGMGAYLLDDTTVRVIFQSESYGPMYYESYPFVTNAATGADFTGSHVMYIDYDREGLSTWMSDSTNAAHLVKDSGELIKEAYNLHGDLIQPRATSGTCAHSAPHFSNTRADGTGCWSEIMADPEPARADWLLQSLCSAHMEQAHQWGNGIGVEDNLFITNEEWTDYIDGSGYTGIPAHAIDVSNGKMYAVGVFTLGGFEKIVEVNCGHTDYVCFSPSGYNGNFGISDMATEAVNLKGGETRSDGGAYVFPQDIVPARIYIGEKGKNAQGVAATDFLSRNGLAYGKLYGFATDIATETGGLYRDPFHKDAASHPVGSVVNGAFYPIDWQWDGTVRDFKYDGSWDFQQQVSDGYYFWTGNGPDASGCKTEHNSPDPYGGSRFMQSSTCGYFGIYDFTGVTDLITAAAAGGGFPTKIPATYTMVEGEHDISSRINLGGKGLKANGQPQTTMSDSYSVSDDGTITDSAKVTFEDVDGIEWFASSDSTDGYLIIQEDGGNDFGERTFFSKILTDGTLPTYHWIAMSGGDDNSRGSVGIPTGTNGAPNTHEFSGAFDLSGMLAKNGDGTWKVTAGATQGAQTRAADTGMAFNDKSIAFGLQAHSLNAGVIAGFQGDRGGQIYLAKPKLP